MDYNILVVDRYGDLLEEVSRFTEKIGFDIKIYPAKSMFEAIRIFEENEIDAILSDFDIGDGDNNGIDLLEWIKENDGTIPFIIFTDQVNKDNTIKALNLQADFFIKKENMQSILSDLFHYIHEVVKDKNTREAIQTAEKSFREVLENSRDCLYKYDFKKKQYVYISPSLKYVMGYTPNELSEMGLSGRRQLNHPDELEMVSKHREMLKHSKPNESYQLEYRFRDPEGLYRWISDNHVVIYDDDTHFNAVIGSMRDITERKTKERLLVLQGELIHDLTKIENVDDAIRISINYVNKATNFDFAMFHLRDEESQDFLLKYSIGADEEMIHKYNTWVNAIENLGITERRISHIANPKEFDNATFSEYEYTCVIPMYKEMEMMGIVSFGSREKILAPKYLVTWLENNINLIANVIVQVQKFIEYKKLSEKS
ncbi:MAG: PAS domain-containing protein [Candidatus Lokiarchaeota archaeon]|nr:PAS domain-containing protein [Candidatus Lokiarchaeota archaeon]